MHRAQPYSYPLFSLSRLISVRDVNRRTNEDEGKVLSISVLASGGFKGHSCIAIACSNNELIIRYSGESRVPLVKRLSWAKEPQNRIVGLCFDPTAQWLMVLSIGGIITLLPAYFLVCRKDNPDDSSSGSSQRSTRDVRNLSILKKLGESLRHYVPEPLLSSSFQQNLSYIGTSKPLVLKPRHLPPFSTCCAWWNPWDHSGSYGLVGTNQGTLYIINLVNGEDVCSISLKSSISSVQLVCDNGRTFRHALINTVGGYQRLLLENLAAHRTYHTIMSAPNPSSPDFLPEVVRVNRATDITVLDTKQGNIVGVFSCSNCQLQIFGPEMGRFALFVYQLPPGTLQCHFTSKLTFALLEDDPPAIAVVSNLLVGTSSNPKCTAALWESVLCWLEVSPLHSHNYWVVVPGFVKTRTQSVMQEFVFPAEEKVKGMFQCASSCDIGFGGGEDASVVGCYVWTNLALYEFRPDVHPERIFFQLIARGQEKTDAENLGKTLCLDLFRLYECAADAYFAKGDHGRALGLYSLSNVRPSKLVFQFLEIGRMDIVITYLRGILHHPDALPASVRRLFSTILLKCYLQRLLPFPRINKAIYGEFEEFLTKNRDYDEDLALSLLWNHGMPFLLLYFVVAHSRKQMGKALQFLADRGVSRLPPFTLKKILENGYAENLKNCPQLFRSLNPQTQMKLLCNPVGLSRYLGLITPLLPLMDRQTLVHVLSFFDPVGGQVPVMGRPRSLSAQRHSMAAPSTYIAYPEEYVEVYLTAIMLYALGSSINRAPPRCETVAEDVDVISVPIDLRPLPQVKKVDQISCGYHHTLVKSDSGEVCSWGANPSGELGLGHTRLEMTPQLVEGLSSITVVRVAAGGEHSFAVSRGGPVWTWGLNNHGQLGLGSRENRSLPTRVDSLKDTWILQIACGYYHSLFLTENGAVFSCGFNNQGQCGVGDTESRLLPTRVALGESVRGSQLAAGYCHSCACSDAGDVYSWGSGVQGQLGHGNILDQSVPKKIAALQGKRIVAISCGSFHTVALTDLSNMYSWGHGTQNQLGHGRPVDVAAPRLVQALLYRRIVSVSCGRWHTVATSDSGEVYSWGSGERGVLGRGLSEDALPAPVSGLTGRQIAAVDCGEWFTVACTASGKVYVWGAGEHGELGTGNTADSQTPTAISLPVGPSKKPSVMRSVLRHDVQGQEALESALANQFGNYRCQVMVQRASDWKNWDAVAVIYELMGQWTAALDARFLAAKQPEDLLDLFKKNYFPRLEMDGGHKLLSMLMGHWKEQRLPKRMFHQYLEQHMEQLAPALALLVESGSLPMELPEALPLIAVRIALQSARREVQQGNQVPQERLWNEIRANLLKDVDKRDYITIPGIIPAAEKSGDMDTIAFTCGHHYLRHEFYTKILPRLNSLISEFPKPILVSARLILAEYHLPSINMACPPCLYNHFLRLQQSEDLTAWKI